MIGVVAAAASAATRIPARCTNRLAPRLCAIHFHVHRTNHYLTRAHRRPYRYHWLAEGHPARRDHYLSLWVRRQDHASHALATYKHSAVAAPWSASWLRDALCIHLKEGAWNDPNAPYWGGMQMDMSFQAAYGPEFLRAYGTADHWPAHDQLIAAYRAWRSRGWGPWPNTAAACGLL